MFRSGYLLLTMFLISLKTIAVSGQEDPFAPFENPFRNAPEGETMEQRAVALLKSQKYSIQKLEQQLEEQSKLIQREKQNRLQVETILTKSLVRHFQGSADEQKFALEMLDSFLSTWNRNDNRKLAIELDGAIEDQLEKGLQSEVLRLPIIQLMERHLLSKGILLGYQPIDDGRWQSVSDVARSPLSATRVKLAKETECFYEGMTLEEVIDDLAMTANFEFELRLTDAQKAQEVEYVSRVVTFEKALSEILTKYGCDYMVDGRKIMVGAKDSRALKQSEMFVVRGLLSKEIDIRKLVDLLKSEFAEQAVKVSIVDGNSFSVSGSETQIKKVARFLGGFRPPRQAPTMTARKLHPAAVFANEIVQAVQQKDVKRLAEMANVSNGDQARFARFVGKVENWFEGVEQISELRKRNGSFIAKIQTIGTEVMVIRIDSRDGKFVLADFNSPSIEDYENLEIAPLHIADR